MTIVWKLA